MHTRLRTNSLILPPRRLRHSPSPPPRHRAARGRHAAPGEPHRPPPPQPLFPPPHVVLHPDDAANRTLQAIGRALLAVENRAVTIKDLSHLVLDYGLVCQNASAASQAITTFVRNHLNRCHQDRSEPLLLSLPLTGTPDDDRLAPALHSRTGGTSSIKDPRRTLTCFRKGTTVWYLSVSAGAPCPFQRAGIAIQDIVPPTPQGTKRKRDDHPHTLPRKLSTPGPAMATRHRVHTDPVPTPATATAAATAAATPSRRRVKLTVTRTPSCTPSRTPSCTPSRTPSCTPSCSSQSDLTDIDSSDMDVPASRVSRGATSDIDDSSSVSSQELPPYPILSPSIPSPSCTTPTTSLASPCSDPFAPYRSSLSSTHFLKSSFASFRTALSNPPPDHRARSRSLPFSAASPPPDSEDEDEDYHNSMIGLRRGSVPLPLKKEEQEQDDTVQKTEPVAPRFVPGSVHVLPKAWDVPRPPPLKQEHSNDVLSTPLEVLPGFVPFTPESDTVSHVPVKDEPMSAVLPPERSVYHWQSVKPEPMNGLEDTVLAPHCELQQHESTRSGTRENPVCVDDVEVLGPESVRSREWDVAWSSGVGGDAADNSMDVDSNVACPCTPLSDPDIFVRRHDETLRASPSETLATAPTSISSPPCERAVAIDSDLDAPVLLHPLRTCDPPVVATVIEGIPVYHTLLAPNVPFLRRIDTSFVNLTPVMTMLGLPLSVLVSYTHVAPRMTVSRAPEPIGGTWVPLSVAQAVTRHAGAGKIPSAILDVFLSADLGMWFPDPLGRLVQLEGNATNTNATTFNTTNVTATPFNVTAFNGECVPSAVREVGIRVEDVFVGADCVEFKQDPRLRPDVFELQAAPLRSGAGVVSRGSSLLFEPSRSACASMSIPLNEQEESLFHSFVDMLGTGVSTSSSPLSSVPASPLAKPAVTAAASAAAGTTTTMTSSAREKENAATSENAPPVATAPVVRRKREKAAVPEVPVRRSKRALAKAAMPVTRSRTRHASEGRAVG